MENKLGLEGAAIGIRHLINYIETKDRDNFNNVKDYIFEVKLWALITFFCNNIDELADSIPEFILEDIFLMKPLEIVYDGDKDESDITKLYGKGYKCNSGISFKDQFNLIRNCMSHCYFTYDNGMIYVDNKRGFAAAFDIVWLERLVKTVLSNKKLSLQKGMSDTSVLAFISKDDCTPEEFKLLCEHGLINIYKVTSLTSNKETIAEAINIPGISSDSITFELIFQAAISIMRRNRIVLSEDKERMVNQINRFFKEIENMFGNKIKLELLPFSVSDNDISDSAFWTLPFKDKLQYLLRKEKYNDPCMYNSTMIYYLLDLLQEIEKDEYKDISLLAINDAYNFLLKIYANIYFAGVKQEESIYSSDLISSYGGITRFVHAKNVYKEYIRVLKRSLAEMEENKLKGRFKGETVRELNLYTRLLEEALKNDPYVDLGWKMRNSLIHNQIEISGDNWRFFTTGKNLHVKHYNKKKKEWEYKFFTNNHPIWEMVISSKSLLALVDNLFLNIGINPLSISSSRIRKKPSV